MENIKPFCELPSLENCQDYLTWHRDPRLGRYLKGLEDRSPAEIAELLVNKILANPTDKLACAGITALLAHILFSTFGRAKIKSQIFNPLQYHSTQIELADVYQIALDIISQPVHFLANFQTDPTNWYRSLVRYSHYRFDRLLIDRLRSIPELSGFKRTNLGLIARTSPRRIKAALICQGEANLRLEQQLLLHKCLVEAISVGEFDTRNPQSVHYHHLSARYIEQCARVELAIDNRAILIERVNTMGIAIRNYLQPHTDTLDRSIDDYDLQGTVLIDLIVDPRDDRFQLESSTLKQDLLELSAKLSIDRDRLLMFFYGLELTQSEVSIELGCDPSTAKRRRDRCLKQLAKDLHTKIFGTTDLSIELLDSILDRFQLIHQDLYGELLLSIFELIVADVNLSSSVTAHPKELKIIANLFFERIEQRWQFDFKPAGMGLAKANAFVKLRSKSPTSLTSRVD